MATTNLSTQSLGGILVQSGDGTPDHTSPVGSLYTDQSSGVLYQNIDGSTGWEQLNTISYGEMYLIANATATPIASQNTWVVVSNIAWGQSDWNGVEMPASPDDHKMQILTGRAGTYQAAFSATINDNGATAGTFQVGLSVNGASPASYEAVTVNATTTNATVTIQAHMQLSDSDTVAVAVRNTANANDVLITHANMILNKVS